MNSYQGMVRFNKSRADYITKMTFNLTQIYSSHSP